MVLETYLYSEDLVTARKKVAFEASRIWLLTLPFIFFEEDES